jgi:ComF family protein
MRSPRVPPVIATGLPGRISSRLLDLAFPAKCVGCGTEGTPICDRCRPGLFARLGRPGGALIGLPSAIPPPLVQLEWCAPFEGLVRSSLHALKYGGERRLARVLGAALADRWRHAGAGGDVLVPVPVHRDRERQRGYDQAVLLARSAGADLGMPVAACLERIRATTAQYELGRHMRAANVARAFRVRPGTAWSVAGAWVVLVDDVATTGATLASCAHALLEAGAIAVSAVTVAKEQ